MRVLTGHIRHESVSPSSSRSDSPLQERFACPVDIQAILTIVGDRHGADPDDHCLDLSNSVISDAWLLKADLREISFWGVHFTRVDFTKAKLDGADFRGATLEGCNFTDADLAGAKFEDVNFLQPIGLNRQQLEKALHLPAGFIERYGTWLINLRGAHSADSYHRATPRNANDGGGCRVSIR